MMQIYSPRLRSVLYRSAKLFRPVITPIENFIYRNVETSHQHVPLFIVGSPRSGSTVLYQMLTHSVDCTYIDNLSYCFMNNLPLGVWLSRLIYKNQSHMRFDSSHGNTNSFHSPSECAGYWHRWFGSEVDYVDKAKYQIGRGVGLENDFNNIMARFDAGIVIKNLSNSQRIQVLLHHFPNAKFLYIKRDPFFVLQSLFLARKKSNIADDAWWSVKPDNYQLLMKLPLLERLVAQIYYNEKRIQDDLKAISIDQKMSVNYVDIASEYEHVLEFTKFVIRNDLDVSDFNFTDSVKVGVQFAEKFTESLRAYNWVELGYDR